MLPIFLMLGLDLFFNGGKELFNSSDDFKSSDE
jgi:hypothetical protein